MFDQPSGLEMEEPTLIVEEGEVVEKKKKPTKKARKRNS